MRLSLARGLRPFPVPRAALAAGALVAVAGLLAAALPGIEEGPVTCPFRVVTGLPCPSCGFLRAAGAALRGDAAGAFRANPLAALLLVAAPGLLALAAANRLFGVTVRIELSPSQRRAWWVLAAIVVLANWVYVLASRV